MVLTMRKEFTLAVPDEYWVDSWKENKTMSWVYEGPEKLYVLMTVTGNFISWQAEEIIRPTDSPEKVVVIDAAVDTDVAYFLVSQPAEHVYEFAQETNHDGSTYEYFINPKIQDLFTLEVVQPHGLDITPIFKKTKTIHEITVQKRKQYVLDFYKTYEFDDEADQLIKEFLTKADAYLEKMEKIYPWKYVEISDSDVPKIPIKLMKILNELKKLGEQP